MPSRKRSKQPIRLLIKNVHSQPLCWITAYPTEVPGILITEIVEEPGTWRLSLQCGFVFGGRFGNPEDARDAASDLARLAPGVDWSREADLIRSDQSAMLAWVNFREKHDG